MYCDSSKFANVLADASRLATRLVSHYGSASGYFLLAKDVPGANREATAIFLAPIHFPNDRTQELVEEIWQTAGILLYNRASDQPVLSKREEAGGLRARDFILVIKGFTPEENEAVVLLLAVKYEYLTKGEGLVLAHDRKNEIFLDLIDCID
jgi:hypothetical protein